MLAEPDWQLAALEMAGSQNVRQLGPKALRLAVESDALPAVRRRAIKAAAQIRAPAPKRELASLLASRESVPPQGRAAALVDLQDWRTVRRLLMDKDASEELRRPKRSIARSASSAGRWCCCG